MTYTLTVNTFFSNPGSATVKWQMRYCQGLVEHLNEDTGEMLSKYSNLFTVFTNLKAQDILIFHVTLMLAFNVEVNSVLMLFCY